MKINMPCPHPGCTAYNHVDIVEHKQIQYLCKNGHSSEAYLTMPIYPLFYQYGLTSYKKGFYFESFMALYKSYETFIRDVVITILYHNTGIQVKHNIRSFDTNNAKKIELFVKKNYRTSSNLSVAFETLYPVVLKKEAPKFNRDLITSRNLFVHNDKIITSEDCQILAEELKRFIRTVEIDLSFGQVSLGNFQKGEWMNMTRNKKNPPLPIETQELEFWMGSMDFDNDFDILLNRALEYDQK